MGKRKFTKGEKINTLSELVSQYEQGKGIYCDERYLSPHWYASIKLSGLKTMVAGGSLFTAISLSPLRVDSSTLSRPRGSKNP